MSKNRTLEELEACDFENMTYGELSEHFENDCTKKCPLFGEFCNGGMSCNGGSPIEPPCANFDNDTILVDVLNKYYDGQRRMEAQEDARIKKEQERKRKAELIAKKRFDYRLRNYKEIFEIERLQNKNEKMAKSISLINVYVLSVNGVNEMFRSANQPCPSDIKPSPRVEQMKLEIEQNNTRIIALKATIRQNEKARKQK